MPQAAPVDAPKPVEAAAPEE